MASDREDFLLPIALLMSDKQETRILSVRFNDLVNLYFDSLPYSFMTERRMIVAARMIFIELNDLINFILEK